MKVPRGTARSRAQKRKEEKEAGSQVGSALRKAPQLQAKDAPRENCGQGKDSRVGPGLLNYFKDHVSRGRGVAFQPVCLPPKKIVGPTTCSMKNMNSMVHV